jgi:hypothetical protein
LNVAACAHTNNNAKIEREKITAKKKKKSGQIEEELRCDSTSWRVFNNKSKLKAHARRKTASQIYFKSEFWSVHTWWTCP